MLAPSNRPLSFIYRTLSALRRWVALHDRVAVRDAGSPDGQPGWGAGSSRGLCAATPPETVPNKIGDPERVKDVRPLQGRIEYNALDPGVSLRSTPGYFLSAFQAEPDVLRHRRTAFVASPQHLAVSLWLTDQAYFENLSEAEPQRGIASRIFLSSRHGKPEAYRYVLRHRRAAFVA